MDLKEVGVSLLGSVDSVDLNGSAGDETALTDAVPTGKKMIVNHVVIRNMSADAASAVVTIGKTGGTCDEFLGNQTLSNLSAAGKYAVLKPVPAATPPAAAELAAGEKLGLEITTAAGGACTCSIDVFGHLVDA